MKLTNFNFLAIVAMTFISFLAEAQIDPPADDDPLPAPIDTKLIWLAIVGTAFVFYFFKTKKIATQ
jgi:hypothetical protein